MSESKEELLRPRFKVIADYPDSPYEVGEILTKIDGIQRYASERRFSTPITVLERYPHLFQPLQWWEERSKEDMPEYIKGTVSGCSYNGLNGQTVCIKPDWGYSGRMDNPPFGYSKEIKWGFHAHDCEIITKEEYETATP